MPDGKSARTLGGLRTGVNDPLVPIAERLVIGPSSSPAFSEGGGVNRETLGAEAHRKRAMAVRTRACRWDQAPFPSTRVAHANPTAAVPKAMGRARRRLERISGVRVEGQDPFAIDDF
jgi:hypothetical protein